MKSWLSALLALFRLPEAAAAANARARPAARQVASPPAVPALLAEETGVATGPARDLDRVVFAWLLAQPVDPAAGLANAERKVLTQLDHAATDASVQGALLPRAAAVVPRLLAQLRSPGASLSALSEQVSRDVTLVVEVIRMANSATYRRGVAVVELEHAIRMLGADGLRFAIGRAVLKPLMEPRSGALSMHSAKRLWRLTDSKAQLSAAAARGLGCEPFDGYLLGLAHSAVWSVVLRALDTASPEATTWRFSAALVRELTARRDRLFALVAQQWLLPSALSTVAAEIAARGLAAAGNSALAQALHMGDHLANCLCSTEGTTAVAQANALPPGLPDSVRWVWLGLARTAGNDAPTAA